MDISPDHLRQVLNQQPGIRQAWVFGSVASGEARADSDLDIAVEADHRLSAVEKMKLMADLAAATGRPVDLIDLKTVGEPLLGQILRHGQRILGTSTEHADLLRRHLFDQADFQPYISRLLHERRAAWRD